MAHETFRMVLAALALTGAAACAGESPSAPPQTPADQTATTSGTPTPTSTLVGEASPPAADPNATSNLGASSRPSGLRSPLDTTPGTSSAPASAGAPSTTGLASSGDTGSLDDGQIVAILQAADLGEIAQAREALRTSKNGRVKQFAQHMVTDHSAAEAKLSSLDSTTGITPHGSSVTEQLKSGADQIMAELKSSGSDFDKTYMDAQVSEHTQVLALLDNKLIPHAQNVDLTKVLLAVRAKVDGHLKMAEDVQSSLTRAK